MLAWAPEIERLYHSLRIEMMEGEAATKTNTVIFQRHPQKVVLYPNVVHLCLVPPFVKTVATAYARLRKIEVVLIGILICVTVYSDNRCIVGKRLRELEVPGKRDIEVAPVEFVVRCVAVFVLVTFVLYSVPVSAGVKT